VILADAPRPSGESEKGPCERYERGTLGRPLGGAADS
jgi:hypothetical protein